MVNTFFGFIIQIKNSQILLFFNCLDNSKKTFFVKQIQEQALRFLNHKIEFVLNNPIDFFEKKISKENLNKFF